MTYRLITNLNINISRVYIYIYRVYARNILYQKVLSFNISDVRTNSVAKSILCSFAFIL